LFKYYPLDNCAYYLSFKVTDNLGADNIDELTIVLTALRRFIFRYLLSDLDDQWSRDPRENVVSQLDDPSLWSLTVTSHTGDVSKDQSTPVFKQLISKFVPQSMRAAEVYSVMTFYDTFVKVSCVMKCGITAWEH